MAAPAAAPDELSDSAGAARDPPESHQAGLLAPLRPSALVAGLLKLIVKGQKY